MAELTAKSACDVGLPLTIGTVYCGEVVCDAITSVSPFPGAEDRVSAAILNRIGAAFPAPNRMTGTETARAVWTGRGQAMVLGPQLAEMPGAALTDQTDAWARIELEGIEARDVLARLVPLDLRDVGLGKGEAARTLIGHMHCILMRPGAERYELMVFRSMTGTLLHELKSAMEAVAARR